MGGVRRAHRARRTVLSRRKRLTTRRSLLAGAAERVGVRLICPDRPGFDASTFQAGRTFRDWPADIKELTEHFTLQTSWCLVIPAVVLTRWRAPRCCHPRWFAARSGRCRDWDINLATITPPTHIWHGLNDRQAAPTWAHHLAARITGATLTMVRDGGHFSTLTDHADQILRGLAQVPRFVQRNR